MAPLNVGEAGRTERTYAQLVSGNFFSALGLRPAAGRFIRADEVERPGAEPVVVLSHDYWQTHYAGSPSAIGQTIRVNDNQLTIIGVAPEDFQGTILGAAVRSVGAGDAGAGAVCGIERAESIAISAAIPRWAGCATARTKRAPQREFVVGDARAGGRVPREQRPHQRRADAATGRRRAARR